MFLAGKIIKVGINQAKKRKAKNQPQFQQPDPNYNYPQPGYPMGEYPPGVAPGTDTKYVLTPPATKAGKLTAMFMSVVRFLQFVFGLTVVALYGNDVHHDHEDDRQANAKWVFAVIVGGLATLTALWHMILPFVKRRVHSGSNQHTFNAKVLLPEFIWEFIICVIWLTLFGIFGSMYIGVYGSDSSSSSSSSSKRDSSSSSSSSSDSGLGDNAKINRMRHAVWVDLVNLVMWVITSTWVLLRWIKSRRAALAAAAAESADPGFDAEKI
ncbi:hypothetical protein N7528_010217 [Penicillium herquei]|nr:hypothetical protein N7528_010217 [Penicillium herquei]